MRLQEEMGHQGRKQEGSSEFVILIENFIQTERKSRKHKILQIFPYMESFTNKPSKKQAVNTHLLSGTTAVYREPEYLGTLFGD